MLPNGQHGSRCGRIHECPRHVGGGIQLQGAKRCAVHDWRRGQPDYSRRRLRHVDRHRLGRRRVVHDVRGRETHGEDQPRSGVQHSARRWRVHERPRHAGGGIQLCAAQRGAIDDACGRGPGDDWRLAELESASQDSLCAIRITNDDVGESRRMRLGRCDDRVRVQHDHVGSRNAADCDRRALKEVRSGDRHRRSASDRAARGVDGADRDGSAKSVGCNRDRAKNPLSDPQPAQVIGAPAQGRCGAHHRARVVVACGDRRHAAPQPGDGPRQRRIRRGPVPELPVRVPPQHSTPPFAFAAHACCMPDRHGGHAGYSVL